MRWSAGWSGVRGPDRSPVAGQPLAGLATTWTCGWPPSRISVASGDDVTLAVVGFCGASRNQLVEALDTVRAGRWRDLTRWPGSYLVIAGRGSQRIVIGDITGQHPAYWRDYEGGTWWSTAAFTLACLDRSNPGPDPVALGADMAIGQPDTFAERSLFPGVRRVPPGKALIIDLNGVTLERFEPLDFEPLDIEEAAPQVRAALSEAVAVRCEGAGLVSADLAGLDSTTLACLAAGHGPVQAVTFADARLRDDDLHYARRTVVEVPALHHQAVPGATDTIYYAGLGDAQNLPVTATPNPYVVTARIQQTLLDAARGTGAVPGVHFTGAAGDGVLSASPDYLADLLRSGRFSEFWLHAAGHARLRQTSAQKVIATAGPASSLTLQANWRKMAKILRGPARAWSPPEFTPIAWASLSAAAAWMRPEVRAQLADALTDAAEHLTASDTPKRFAAYTDRQDLLRVAANTAGWATVALEGSNVEVSAPYLDNEVVRACLSVPAEQRGRPDRFKPLLRAAFVGTGVVPEFVLSRTTKGGYDGVAYAGLTAHAAEIVDLLGASSRLAGVGLVDPDQIKDIPRRAMAGLRVPQGALHAAVAAEVWMRQLEAASTWWEESPTHAAVA